MVLWWGGAVGVGFSSGQSYFSFSPSSFPEPITEGPAGLEVGEGGEGSLGQVAWEASSTKRVLGAC